MSNRNVIKLPQPLASLVVFGRTPYSGQRVSVPVPSKNYVNCRAAFVYATNERKDEVCCEKTPYHEITSKIIGVVIFANDPEADGDVIIERGIPLKQPIHWKPYMPGIWEVDDQFRMAPIDLYGSEEARQVYMEYRDRDFDPYRSCTIGRDGRRGD